METASPSPERRKRRLPRLSLRALLVLVTLLAIWFGYEADRAHRQRRALNLARRAGGEIWWSAQAVNSAPAPDDGASWLASLLRQKNDWIDSWLGERVDADVAALDLSGTNVTERDLRHLAGLKNLQWLSLADLPVSDQGLKTLVSLEKLQWLDLSGTNVTAEGVQPLRELENLKWLNLDGTTIAAADLEALSESLPDLEIGRPFVESSTAAIESPIARNIESSAATPDTSAELPAAWEAYQQAPYDDDAFAALMNVLGQNPTKGFRSSYISGVYRAARAEGEPLWVVQIYNGTKNVSFNLGCLVVLAPDGRHLNTIDKERTHWSLMAPDFDQYKLIQERVDRGEVIDLPDLNGDQAADIPTQRWNPLPGETSGESTAIYTSDGDSIRCLLRLHTGDSKEVADIAWSSVYLRPTPAPGVLELVSPIFVDATNRQMPGGMQLTYARDDDQPMRVMARFKWSSETQSFLGPAHGPQNLWRMHPR